MAATESQQSIPDHALLRCIGAGSSGQVWLARNSLNEYRAVKIVRRAAFDQEEPYLRELNGIRKFEPISRTHPGFLHVLHVGKNEAEGYFYYIMELADDVGGHGMPEPELYRARTVSASLHESGTHMTAAEVLALGLRLSDALQHLHEQGLVHRDIKPSNLLYVAGRPKLADIGLVTEQDRNQSFVGTLGFIPPDGPGTVAADIFALGKVLYECLTGFDRERFPDLPSFFDHHPDRKQFLELNEIIVKASHPVRELRYASAQQLYGELAAVANGKSVLRLRQLERRWAKAKRGVWVGAAAIALGALVIGLEIRESQRQERDRQRSAGRLLSDSSRAMDAGDLPRALQATAEVIASSPGDRSEMVNRLRYGLILGQMPKLVLLRAMGDSVTSCRLLPDGSAIVVDLAGKAPQLIDVATGKTLREFANPADVIRAIDVDSDGQFVATGARDRTARVFEIATGVERAAMLHSNWVSRVRFIPGGTHLATGAKDGKARIWDWKTRTLLREFTTSLQDVEGLAVNNAETLLATSGTVNQIEIWNVKTGERVGSPISTASWVRGIEFTPDGRFLVAGDLSNYAYVWDVATHALVRQPMLHGRGVPAVCIARDGLAMATASWDGKVRFWRLKTGLLLNSILQESAPVEDVSLSRSGNLVATGCTDGTVRVWDRAGSVSFRELDAECFSRDGRRFLCTNGCGVTLCETAPEPPALASRMLPGKFVRSWLNRDGTRAAVLLQNTPGESRSLALCRFDAKSPVAEPVSIPVTNANIECIWSPTALLAVIDGIHISVLDSQNGTAIFPTLTNAAPNIAAAFSGDGTRIALSDDTDVVVRRVSDGRAVLPPLHHSIRVQRCVFSPHDDLLLVCTSDVSRNGCYAQAWELRSGRPYGGQLWHTDGVEDGAWISDRNAVVTVGEDGKGIIWDLPSGNPTQTEISHLNQIHTIDIEPTLHLALTSSWDATARLWDLERGLPVGPPYRFDSSLQSARMAGRDRFVVETSGVAAWVHKSYSQELRATPWTPALLQRVADVLASRTSITGSADQWKAAAALEAEWRALRLLLPEVFRVSKDDLLDWHAAVGAFAYKDYDFVATTMHWGEVLKSRPNDSRMVKRFAWSQNKLREQEQK